MHLFKWTLAIGLSFLAMVGGVNHILIDSLPKDVVPYYWTTPHSDLPVRVQPYTEYQRVTFNPQGSGVAR